jgi:hypothetical protein
LILDLLVLELCFQKSEHSHNPVSSSSSPAALGHTTSSAPLERSDGAKEKMGLLKKKEKILEAVDQKNF